MSLLAPLYILGALAVAAPVIFHLIRRQVKQRTPLSTMMFLPTTQPKLSRRSRLENLPLLLLRALALILLALAFSRPFLRSSTTTDAGAASRQMVVMIDTSASMRRGDLWNQAMEHLRDVTTNLQPGDSVAIVSFDSRPRLRLGFDAANEMSIESRRVVGNQLFAGELPSWNATDLGAALRFVADIASGSETSGSETATGSDTPLETGRRAPDGASAIKPSQSALETQVVLISDMQTGARLDALQGIAWPKRLPVEVRAVVANEKTNAWITLPSQQEEIVGATDNSANGQADRRFRLRVSNSQQSRRSQFRLAWIDPSKPDSEQSGLTVEVPPGQSRIVRVEQPPSGATAIVLLGDDHDFDNRRFYASQSPELQTLMFVGDDPSEPRDSLFYYLQRLSLDTPNRTVSIRSMMEPVPQKIAVSEVPLVIVSGEITDTAAATYKDYVQSGGRLVYIIPPARGNDSGQQSLTRLTGAQEWAIAEADIKDYALLARIDFTHPLFSPFADPKYNDFSKIRFWAHRVLLQQPEGWKTLASFDNGSPVLLERRESVADGEPAGRLWIMTVGWQPIESQLALSTKFIPLIFGLFDTGGDDTSRFAEQSVRMGAEVASLVGVDGNPWEIKLLAGGGERASDGQPDALAADASIDRPGIYQWTSAGRTRTFAVNIDESESETDPIGADELERMGVVIGKSITPEVAEQAERQMRDIELESQQRLWRWLLVGVLGLLATETIVSGWLSRRRRVLTVA